MTNVNGEARRALNEARESEGLRCREYIATCVITVFEHEDIGSDSAMTWSLSSGAWIQLRLWSCC